MSNENPYRSLPSVDKLRSMLRSEGQLSLSPEYLIRIIQSELDIGRSAIANGSETGETEILDSIRQRINRLQTPRLAPLVNATGILIHTNLGRSPVSNATAAAIAEAAGNYVPLELDPATNIRGGRMSEISELMRVLTNAESTLVVNNNAAAVLLTLAATAANREVIVSRGEAVEIGGGFRIPDVLRQSGAKLVEIGTTNRTYARDYEAAIGPDSAALLKVHRSNFSIEGFATSASIVEVGAIGKHRGIPVIDDQGSGALVDVSQFGLGAEPTISASLAAGASIVTCSGDKLLGGPQAGIIVGSRSLVETIARHPLARSVRADKACLAGLAATLRHYLAGEEFDAIPVLRMLTASVDSLGQRARDILDEVGNGTFPTEIVASQSSTGGGSLPGQLLESRAIEIAPVPGKTIDELARRLRTAEPAVFGRIERDRLLLDLCSVLPEQDERLISALRKLNS